MREHSGALFLLVATTVANVLAYGYQVVQARLLRPEQYAALTALFGILILESVSSQVIQSATATLVARYRARDEMIALRAFVRRWSVRLGGASAALGLVVGLRSPFLALSAVILLAYAALTNIDAVLARTVLAPEQAGAYAGAITMGKIVLFAPIAVGFILLERTASAHARGEDTARFLFLALGFVLVTSGVVAFAYVLVPGFLVPIVVGSQYPETARIVGTYGIAALANALLNL